MKNSILFCFAALLALVSCSKDNTFEQEQVPAGNSLTAAIADGLHRNWSKGDRITLLYDGQAVSVETLASGGISELSGSVEGTFTDENPLYGVYPADNAISSDREGVTITVPTAQTTGSNGYDAKAAVSVARTVSEILTFQTIGGGIKLNFQMSGVTKVELESVDGYALAGTATIKWDEQGKPVVAETGNAAPILVFSAADNSSFTAGKDYYISTLPCDLYGGYRLSIYKDGLVAHYFSVHQTVERADYITPTDLTESELEFDDPDAPLVEEERPELDATTTALLRQYQQNPTEENKQALLNQMGLRYDKVVARKKVSSANWSGKRKRPISWRRCRLSWTRW